MALKVIGAGWGRTGTDSLREALNILGFGPCHHMFEVRNSPVQTERWRALAAGAAPDWEALFEGFQSAVDWPSAHYWRALMQVYPEARVILTWREAESWWTSFSGTIQKGTLPGNDPASLGMRLVREQALEGRPEDREHCLRLYRANIEAVLREVPPGRLLVHRLGDGWAPLCAFLGVPVPDQPYGKRNSTAEMQARMAAEFFGRVI